MLGMSRQDGPSESARSQLTWLVIIKYKNGKIEKEELWTLGSANAYCDALSKADDVAEFWLFAKFSHYEMKRKGNGI